MWQNKRERKKEEEEMERFKVDLGKGGVESERRKVGKEESGMVEESGVEEREEEGYRKRGRGLMQVEREEEGREG